MLIFCFLFLVYLTSMVFFCGGDRKLRYSALDGAISSSMIFVIIDRLQKRSRYSIRLYFLFVITYNAAMFVCMEQA